MPHQIKEARRRRDNGEPMGNMAKRFNVSHSTIRGWQRDLADPSGHRVS
jgi:hypothetical protein